jgi:hypothetical protein
MLDALSDNKKKVACGIIRCRLPKNGMYAGFETPNHLMKYMLLETSIK